MFIKHKFQMRPGFKHYAYIDGEFRKIRPGEVIVSFPERMQGLLDRFEDVGAVEDETAVEPEIEQPQPTVVSVSGEKRPIKKRKPKATKKS